MRQLMRSLLLISAAALPMIVFSVAMVVQFNGQQRSAVEGRLQQAARSAILAVDRQLQDQLAMLDTLASSPLLDTGAMESFRSHAVRVVRRNPNWLGIQLYELGGARPLIDVSAPGIGPLPVSAIQEELESVAEKGDAVIGGGIAGNPPDVPPFVPLGHIVDSRDGRRYLIVAAIRTDAISQALVSEFLPESWTVAVLDRHLVIVGRTRSPERFVGTRATSSLTEEISRSSENFFFSTNKEGDRVYTAFSKSAYSGWTTALGVPAEVIEAPLRRTQWATVGGGIGAFGLATLLGVVLIQGNSRRERLERQLETERATERRLSDIAIHFPGVIFRRVMLPDGRIDYTYLSEGGPGFRKLFAGIPGGAPTIEDIGRLVAPEDRRRWKEAMARSARTLDPFFAEGRLVRADGSVVWVRAAANARQRDDGSIVWDGVVLDISDRVKAEEELRRTLAERESLLDEKITLLNEVHHRVKNNLQIMTSLIRMEQREIHDPQARTRLDVVSQRIQVMARLHEQLYASGDLARIDVGDTLRQICRDIDELHGRPEIDLRVEADSVLCDLRVAIPLGLLANELITNSLKHGFPAGRTGVIAVSLRHDPTAKSIELAVSDDGVGPSAGPANVAEAGVGTKLVGALARQLGAEVRTDTAHGTRLTVVIPGPCT